MRVARRTVLTAGVLALCALSMLPASVLAADPPTGPMTLKTVNFETTSPHSLTLQRIQIVGDPVTPAYWGKTTSSKRTGSYGLWCAATPYGSSTNYWPYYPNYTRGLGSLDAAVLADYYSAALSYYYLMPTRGAWDDATRGAGLGLAWRDSATTDTQSDPVPFALTTSWLRRQNDLTNAGNDIVLSRRGGSVEFSFFDAVELGGVFPTRGQGPTIDDITVTAYKYGPVRNLAAASSATGVRLTWNKPYRATDSTTVEERTVSYRVWRKPQATPTDPWTELTAAARVADSGTSVTYTDTTAADGINYTYRVITYDSGTGTGYGSWVDVIGYWDIPAPPPVMTSLSSASHPLGTWGASSNVSLAWSATGATLEGYGVAFDQSPSTNPATVTHTGTSTTTTAAASGTYYAHVAAKDIYGQWSVTSHLQVLVDLTKPTATDDVNAAGYEGSATVVLSATDAHSGVSGISYTIDGGAPVNVAGSSASFTIGSPGTYELEYTATDNAGNTSVAQQKTIVVEDPPPPASPSMTSLISSSHPAGVWDNSQIVNLEWSATGTAITGYGLVFDQSASTPASATVNQTGTSTTRTAAASGAYWAHVAAYNGSWSTTRHLQVLVDLTPPTAADDVNAAGYDGTATVTVSATDAHSGVAGIAYTIDGGAPVNVVGSSASFTIGSPGTYHLEYTATDNAGNTSGVQQDTIVVREIVPPDRGISVVAMVDPLQVSFGQAATFSYTIHNTGDVAIDDLTVTDFLGPVTSGVPASLAADASVVVQRPYTTSAADDFVLDTVTVSGDADGVTVTDSSTIRLEVYNPALSVSVGPAVRPVAAGKSAQYDIVVTNTGDVDLDVAGTIAAGTSNSTVGPTTLAAGDSVTLTGDVKMADTATGLVNVNATINGTCGSGETWQKTVSGGGSAQAEIIDDRFAGATRTATAVAMSKAAFSSADNVVIATGYGFPDALSASALAASLDAPLLLVKADSVPSEVLAEIDRLGAATAYVVGGEAVVKPSARTQLTGAGLTVVPVAGTNRYDTAKRVADTVRTREGARPTVFLATGLNFPDALAASSLAASMRAPILLTKPDALPAETLAALRALRPDTVVICGGTGVVSSAVENAVKNDPLIGAAVVRKGGTDRYKTAKLIIEWGRDSAGLAPGGIDGMYLASGTNFPDALAGGVFAAAYPDAGWRPLMLTKPLELVPEVPAIVQENPSLRFLTAVGGDSALAPAVYQAALGYVP